MREPSGILTVLPCETRWRDPFGVRHGFFKCVDHQVDGPSVAWYETWCGYDFNGGDLNSRTTSHAAVTCARCLAVGEPRDVS
jgi:hypothetical protein